MSYIEKYKLTLFILFSVWLTSTLIAPYTIPSHSAYDLSGKGGQIDNEKVWEKMNPFAAFIYFLGDVSCTEIAAHSYYLNDNQMPFCARCTGIFIGLVVGMLIALLFNPKFNLLLVALGILPMVIDGGLQLVTTYQSINPLRVTTGLLAGIAISLYLSHVANVMLTPIRQKDEAPA